MIARADLAICILTVAILVVGCAKQKSITRAKGLWLGPIAQSESKGLSFAGIKPGEAWSDVQARIEPTCRIVKRNANRYSVICPSWSFEVQTKTEQRGLEQIEVLFGDSGVNLMQDGRLIAPLREPTFLSQVRLDNLIRLRTEPSLVEYSDTKTCLVLQHLGARKEIAVISLSTK